MYKRKEDKMISFMGDEEEEQETRKIYKAVAKREFEQSPFIYKW